MNRSTDIGNKLWYVLFSLITALIGLIVGVVPFLTGKSWPELWFKPTPTVVLSMIQMEPAVTETAGLRAPVSTAAPTATPFRTPTTLPTPTIQNTPVGWSGILSVRMPTLNEIRAETPISLWDANLINLRDRTEPGVENYTGKAQVGQEYLLPSYWCAMTTPVLTQNMEAIHTSFLVNGEVVPEKYILNYNYDQKSGWKCSYDTVILGGWVKGVSYQIEVKRTLSAEISDGQSSYPAGDYIQRVRVSVP